jgi:hypothetical protein
MGKYINRNSKGELLPPFNKAKSLIDDGATIVDDSKYLENMICVIENPLFDAAGYAFSESEYEVFKQPDGRDKVWLVHPMAKELAE